MNKKKTAKIDLLIIMLSALIPMVIYLFFSPQWRAMNQSSYISFWSKFLVQCFLSYSLAGFGFSITMILHREKFSNFGLVRKNIVTSVVLSIVAFLPHLTFLIISRGFHGYIPMSGAIVFDSVMLQSLPTKLICMSIVYIIWGFCEGFTYVYVHEKINILIPSKNKWFNIGAILLGILCVFMHGGISLDIVVVFDAITMFIFVYVILIVKDITGNAWGVIFSFLFLWNAFPAK